CATSYAPFFKKHNIGEICWGLALFGMGIFCYLLVKDFDMCCMSISTLLAFLVFSFYIVDQLPDVKGPTEKMKGLIGSIVNGGIKPSSFFWFSVTACYILQFGFVLLNWLPFGTLFSIFSLPLAHITGVMVDYRIEQGAKLGLLWMIAFVLGMGFGGTVA
ncbi:MAG: hypothetical protein QMD22_10440, partial [archaeon]|nr:hypothetical protein [archaeon]